MNNGLDEERSVLVLLNAKNMPPWRSRRRRRGRNPVERPLRTPTRCALWTFSRAPSALVRALPLRLLGELEDVGAVLHVAGHVRAQDGLNYRLPCISELHARKARKYVVRSALLE